MMEVRLKGKQETSLVDIALNSFKQKAGVDFYSMLTNNSVRQKYNKADNKDYSEYIDESKDVYSEIECIKEDLNL